MGGSSIIINRVECKSMKGVNKAVIIGSLGNDPELRASKDGNACCNFNVATNEEWRDKNGEKQSRTEWHRIVTWGKLAEICGQYLTKGSSVYLEGKIQTRKWQNKEGVDQYTTEIVAGEMQMLGSKGDKPDSKPVPKGNRGKPDAVDLADGFGEDDIPFN